MSEANEEGISKDISEYMETLDDMDFDVGQPFYCVAGIRNRKCPRCRHKRRTHSQSQSNVQSTKYIHLYRQVKKLIQEKKSTGN